MRTSLRIVIVVLISASGSFYLLSRFSPIDLKAQQVAVSRSSQPGQMGSNQIAPQVTSSLFVGSAASPAPESRSAADLAPALEDVRNEVRKNPEGTPASLLFFASTMGKRFQIATLSQANATSFFEEIYSCVDDLRPIAASARALCLREGERLTHYYPALRSNFELLATRATPEVRRLALHR